MAIVTKTHRASRRLLCLAASGVLLFQSIEAREARTTRATAYQGAAVNELRSQLATDKRVYSQSDSIRLVWTLTNATVGEMLVLSHYATTDRKHFDNLELQITREPERKTWSIPLIGPRKAATQVVCLLQPGRTLRHQIELTEWLRIQKVHLGAGSFEVVAIYRVSENQRAVSDWASCDDMPSLESKEPRLVHGMPRPVWRGISRSEPAAFRIAGN